MALFDVFANFDPLSEIRNEISNRNLTTRENTDNRLTPKAFSGPGLNQQIAIRELDGG